MSAPSPSRARFSRRDVARATLHDTVAVPATGTTDAAEAVGAVDVFVLRRVAEQRFVHLGGHGRAEGWAGIVEVSLEEETLLAEALRTGRPVQLDQGGRDVGFGPYYARVAAIVPV